MTFTVDSTKISDQKAFPTEYPTVVRYGPFTFAVVTRINEYIANQTLISAPSSVIDYHGGNATIQIHGFFRGERRREAKNVITNLRDMQAGMAHIPYSIYQIADLAIGWLEGVSKHALKIVHSIVGDTGFGQIALFAMAMIMWDFDCEMVHRNACLIQSMEFEHSGQYKDEYAYTISFQQISMSMVSYFIDFAMSFTNGIYGYKDVSNLSNMDTNDPTMGNNIEYALNGATSAIEGQLVNIDSIINNDYISNLLAKLSDIDPTGQLKKILTYSDDGYPSLPANYRATPSLDGDLEWRQLPFQGGLPHSNVFSYGGKSYKMTWKLMDPLNDDDIPEYYLLLELRRNNSLVYVGKVSKQIQYDFSEVHIYVVDFSMTVERSKAVSYKFGGMIAFA